MSQRKPLITTPAQISSALSLQKEDKKIKWVDKHINEINDGLSTLDHLGAFFKSDEQVCKYIIRRYAERIHRSKKADFYITLVAQYPDMANYMLSLNDYYLPLMDQFTNIKDIIRLAQANPKFAEKMFPMDDSYIMGKILPKLDVSQLSLEDYVNLLDASWALRDLPFSKLEISKSVPIMIKDLTVPQLIVLAKRLNEMMNGKYNNKKGPFEIRIRSIFGREFTSFTQSEEFREKFAELYDANQLVGDSILGSECRFSSTLIGHYNTKEKFLELAQKNIKLAVALVSSQSEWFTQLFKASDEFIALLKAYPNEAKTFVNAMNDLSKENFMALAWHDIELAISMANRLPGQMFSRLCTTGQDFVNLLVCYPRIALVLHKTTFKQTDQLFTRSYPNDIWALWRQLIDVLKAHPDAGHVIGTIVGVGIEPMKKTGSPFNFDDVFSRLILEYVRLSPQFAAMIVKHMPALASNPNLRVKADDFQAFCQLSGKEPELISLCISLMQTRPALAQAVCKIDEFLKLDAAMAKEIAEKFPLEMINMLAGSPSALHKMLEKCPGALKKLAIDSPMYVFPHAKTAEDLVALVRVAVNSARVMPSYISDYLYSDAYNLPGVISSLKAPGQAIVDLSQAAPELVSGLVIRHPRKMAAALDVNAFLKLGWVLQGEFLRLEPQMIAQLFDPKGAIFDDFVALNESIIVSASKTVFISKYASVFASLFASGTDEQRLAFAKKYPDTTVILLKKRPEIVAPVFKGDSLLKFAEGAPRIAWEVIKVRPENIAKMIDSTALLLKLLDTLQGLVYGIARKWPQQLVSIFAHDRAGAGLDFLRLVKRDPLLADILLEEYPDHFSQLLSGFFDSKGGDMKKQVSQLAEALTDEKSTPQVEQPKETSTQNPTGPRLGASK
jgi:hypothetical protein